MSVRGKVNFTLMVPLLILAIGCVGLLWAQYELKNARQAMTRSLEAIAQIEALRSQALEQQTRLRGYLATGQARFLEAYESSVSEFDAQAGRLSAPVGETPSQGERFEKVRQLMLQWRAEAAKRGFAEARTRASEMQRTVRADGELMDALKQQFRNILLQERTLLAERDARMQQLQLLSSGLLLGVLVLVGVSGLISLASLRRRLARPLSDFAGLMARLDQGERFEIPHRGRADEVGAVAVAFERVRDVLADQFDRDWIGHRAAAVLAALQPCETEDAFGQVLSRELCAVLGAGYAIAYRWEEREQVLELCASHGLSDTSTIRKQYRLDDEPVGRCLADRRGIERVLTPAGSLNEATGLRSESQVMLLLPLIAREHAVAVVMIALRRELESRQRKLLDQLRIPLALNWSDLARGLRAAELIEQHQVLIGQLQASEENRSKREEQLLATTESLGALADKFDALEHRCRTSEQEARERTEQLQAGRDELTAQAQKLIDAESECRRLDEDLRARELALEDQRQQREFAEAARDALIVELRTREQALQEQDRKLADAEDEFHALKLELHARDEAQAEQARKFELAQEQQSIDAQDLQRVQSGLEEQASALRLSRKELEEEREQSQRRVLDQNSTSNDEPGFAQTLRSGSLISRADSAAVLIVAHNPGRAQALAGSIRKLGLEVMVAYSAGEALAIIRRGYVFGVLLDAGLPIGSGAALNQQLRRDPRTRAIPVYEISSGETAGYNAASGIVAFLHKPASRAAIFKALENLGSEADERKRILVVDRNPMARADVARALAATPMQLMEASSAEEGLRALRGRSFDGMLLDPDLADATGVEFVSEAAKQGPVPPMVIYSRRELTAEEEVRLGAYAASGAADERAFGGLDRGVARFLEALPR